MEQLPGAIGVQPIKRHRSIGTLGAHQQRENREGFTQSQFDLANPHDPDAFQLPSHPLPLSRHASDLDQRSQAIARGVLGIVDPVEHEVVLASGQRNGEQTFAEIGCRVDIDIVA